MNTLCKLLIFILISFITNLANGQVSNIRVVESNGKVDVKANIASAYDFKQVFWCVAATPGWVVANRSCQFMNENGFLYRYSGTNGLWGWTGVKSVPLLLNSSEIATTFQRQDVGNASMFGIVVQGWGGGLVLANASVQVGSAPPPATPLQSIVPLYAAPAGASSDPLLQISGQRGSVVITGNNSGSGGVCSASSKYKAAVTAMKNSGAKVFVYLHVVYGERDGLDVLRDLEGYSCLSGLLEGVFIDESPSTLEGLGLVKSVKRRMIELGLGAKVFGNVGKPDLVEAYVNVYDVIVTFEGTYNSYSTAYSPSSNFLVWSARYPVSRFAHIVHSTSLAQAKLATALARERRAGYFHATDVPGAPSNTYGSLPSYWQSLPSILSQ
jgi:hypothetical protein